MAVAILEEIESRKSNTNREGRGFHRIRRQQQDARKACASSHPRDLRSRRVEQRVHTATRETQAHGCQKLAITGGTSVKSENDPRCDWESEASI